MHTSHTNIGSKHLSTYKYSFMLNEEELEYFKKLQHSIRKYEYVCSIETFVECCLSEFIGFKSMLTLKKQ